MLKPRPYHMQKESKIIKSCLCIALANKANKSLFSVIILNPEFETQVSLEWTQRAETFAQTFKVTVSGSLRCLQLLFCGGSKKLNFAVVERNADDFGSRALIRRGFRPCREKTPMTGLALREVLFHLETPHNRRMRKAVASGKATFEKFLKISTRLKEGSRACGSAHRAQLSKRWHLTGKSRESQMAGRRKIAEAVNSQLSCVHIVCMLSIQIDSFYAPAKVKNRRELIKRWSAKRLFLLEAAWIVSFKRTTLPTEANGMFRDWQPRWRACPWLLCVSGSNGFW